MEGSKPRVSLSLKQLELQHYILRAFFKGSEEKNKSSHSHTNAPGPLNADELRCTNYPSPGPNTSYI